MSVPQRISLFVLSAIHFLFLFVLITGNLSNIAVRLTLILSLFLMIVGYEYSPKSMGVRTKIGNFIDPLAITLASVLTFYLSIDLEFGAVIASAGVGFVGSYLSMFKSPQLKSLPVPIYCGSFVGMCSSLLEVDYFFVGYAGLGAGFIYLLTRDALNGVGGKLGTIAFGGVMLVSFIYSML